MMDKQLIGVDMSLMELSTIKATKEWQKATEQPGQAHSFKGGHI